MQTLQLYLARIVVDPYVSGSNSVDNKPNQENADQVQVSSDPLTAQTSHTLAVASSRFANILLISNNQILPVNCVVILIVILPLVEAEELTDLLLLDQADQVVAMDQGRVVLVEATEEELVVLAEVMEVVRLDPVAVTEILHQDTDPAHQVEVTEEGPMDLVMDLVDQEEEATDLVEQVEEAMVAFLVVATEVAGLERTVVVRHHTR